jgi:hypothetical protein
VCDAAPEVVEAAREVLKIVVAGACPRAAVRLAVTFGVGKSI